MTEPNVRGEVTVTLDGAQHVLRPSFEAVQAIEEKTGTGLVALLNSVANGTAPSRTLAVIVTELVKAWGRAGGADADPIQRAAASANADRIGKLIYEAGQDGVMARVSVVLMGALTGGVTASGEWKEPAKKAETPAAG